MLDRQSKKIKAPQPGNVRLTIVITETRDIFSAYQFCQDLREASPTGFRIGANAFWLVHETVRPEWAQCAVKYLPVRMPESP